MSVRIVNECGVVSGPVVAIARAAVVLRPRGERGGVERLHLHAAGGFEGEVRRLHGILAGDPEVGVLAVVEAPGFAELHVVAIAERLERPAVEGLGSAVVADGQGGVRNHGMASRGRAVRRAYRPGAPPGHPAVRATAVHSSGYRYHHGLRLRYAARRGRR